MLLFRYLFLCFIIQLIPNLSFAQSDAGIVVIDSLKSSYCGEISKDVYVRIKNFASSKQLDSVSIGWSVNGTSQTSKQYTTAVKAGDTSASFKLGNTKFSSGSYKIKVWTFKPNNSTDANTSNDTITYTLTVYNLPTPQLQGDSVVCRNTWGYSYYTQYNTGSSYSWNIKGGTITAGSGTNSITVTWGHNGIGNLSVTETNSQGCKANSGFNIIINKRPVPVLKAVNATCGNMPTSFTTKSNTGNTYQWYASLGTITSGQNTNSVTVSWSSTYGKIAVRETNALGCDTVVQEHIEASTGIIADFTFTASCNDTTFFSDKSSTTSGTISSYSWDFGDGDTSSLKAPNKIFDKAGNYNVKLIVKNITGCTDSITKQVTITTKPKADFAIDNGCAPLVMKIKNNTVIDSGYTLSYKWFFENGNTSTQENPVHTLTAPGQYKVKLIVTANTGCEDSIIKNVTVYPNPKASFTSENKCANSAISFKNTSAIDTPSYIISYLWHFGDGDSSVLQNPVHAYTKAGQYKITLQVTSSVGCTDTVSNHITVYPLPQASFSTNNICVKDSAYFVNASISGGDYKWDFGDNSFSGLKDPSHKYTSPGIYNVTLKVKNSQGCIDSLVKQIEVYDIPKANFSAMDICITDNLQIIDSSKNAASYLWNFGDNSTSTLQNPSHKYKSAGTYIVSLTVSKNNGCKDSISRMVTVDSTCVWPGDANADKIVDNKDILAIGLAYSDTGSKRTDTSTIWKGNIVKDWSNNFSTGANYKHADSDGNGIVSASDTMAVTRNYTKTHAKKHNTSRGKNTDPIFKIEIQNDSLKAGDTLVAYIILGENALPAKDVYGLAFSLNYNKDYFLLPEVDFSGSWLGNNIIGYSNFTNGLDIAITRTDQKNVSGAGKIATLKLIMKKEVETGNKLMKLGILDNILISTDEQEIAVNLEDDSVKTYKAPNSIFSKAKSELPEIKVYPNPFKDQTIIEYALIQPGKVNIELFDINGRTQTLMSSTLLPSGNHLFILNSDDYKMSSGVYLIRLEIDGIPTYQRIIRLK